MSTCTLPAFLDATYTALHNRAGLASVNVFTCPVDPAQLGKEAIELADSVEVTQARASLGSDDLEESYDVKGSVLVFAQGTSNAAAKVARDRALAILEEVTDEIAGNETMTSTVRDVTITGQTWTQGYAPEGQLGRFCRVEFTLACEAHVTP